MEEEKKVRTESLGVPRPLPTETQGWRWKAATMHVRGDGEVLHGSGIDFGPSFCGSKEGSGEVL